MGQVVPFIARVRDSGDWTAAERARLEALADQLAAGGVDVEVIFGATDEGDPWCVVTDGAGDVLIHVARIGGKFVVHSAVDDTVDESFDLHAALRERLSVTEDLVAPKSATILPFTAREGQSFLALVVAAAFFYETAGIGGEAHAAEVPQPPPEEPAPQPATADGPGQDREVAIQGAALKDPEAARAPVAAIAVAAPVETAAQAAPLEQRAPALDTAGPADAPRAPVADEAPAVIQGAAGDDSLVGTAAAERIEGGDGDDTLVGGGGRDTLLGGDGDDRIEFTDGATVDGGAGADTLVVGAATQGGGPERLLGVVFNFAFDEGDRIFTAAGRAVHLPWRPEDRTAPHDPPPDDPPTLQPPADGGFGTNGFGPTTLGPPPPLTRVDVDVDGDGVVDGYLLVGFRASGVTPPPPQPHDDQPPITITGQPLPPPDPFG